MSSDIAISVRSLGKTYTIQHNRVRHTTAGEMLAHRLRNPFERPKTEEFKALDDLTFEVRQGEVLGVIGRNGAGKSTLLKILSRITAPTKGEVNIFGRVGSLLEVGTGFHPELTGRENIFLNGAILGMRRRTIERKFDEIVDFAGVEQFLDTPVKRYSSGMYVRLAFAVAASLDTQILLVDEVLAVGDAEFQQRCLGKMEEAAAGEGRTVFFVSHNMQAIERLCQRCLLLGGGQLEFDGSSTDAASEYLRAAFVAGHAVKGGDFALLDRPSSGPRGGLLRRLTVLRDGIPSDRVRTGDPLSLAVEVEGLDQVVDGRVGIRLVSEIGTTVASFSPLMKPFTASERHCNETITLMIPSLPLNPGRYSIDVGVAASHENLQLIESAGFFAVEPSDYFDSGWIVSGRDGLISLDHSWSVGATSHA